MIDCQTCWGGAACCVFSLISVPSVGAQGGGLEHREIAEALRFSPCLSKWARRERETGSPAPEKIGGRKPGTLSGDCAEWLRRRVASGPVTLRGLTAELAERGVKTAPGAVWVFLHAEGLSFKKNSVAAGADAP